MQKETLIVRRIYIESAVLEDLVYIKIFTKSAIILWYFAGKNGIAINLVDGEKCMNICKYIENHFKKSIQLLDTGNSDEIEKIGY